MSDPPSNPSGPEAVAAASSRTTGEAPRSRLRSLLRRSGWVVLLSIVVAVPLVLRVGWEGRAELAQAERAAIDDDVDLEIEHLGRAARWRLPGLSHDEKALGRLVAIGEAQERRGSDGTQMALAAYREARRALLATRAWGVPHPEVLADVNQRIARLMARQEAELGTDVSGSGDPYAYHLELLQEVPGPDPVRGNLAALSFVAWLVATGGFILRGLDAQGRVRSRPALRWGGASLLLLLAWTLLLRLA